MVEPDGRPYRALVHRSVHFLERPRPTAAHRLTGPCLPLLKKKKGFSVLSPQNTISFSNLFRSVPQPLFNNPSKNKKRGTWKLLRSGPLRGSFRERKKWFTQKPPPPIFSFFFPLHVLCIHSPFSQPLFNIPPKQTWTSRLRVALLRVFSGIGNMGFFFTFSFPPSPLSFVFLREGRGREGKT